MEKIEQCLAALEENLEALQPAVVRVWKGNRCAIIRTNKKDAKQIMYEFATRGVSAAMEVER